MSYGLEALRKFRETQEGRGLSPDRPGSVLAEIRPDAPADAATITVWNGERFVAYDRWLARAPIVREEMVGPPGAASSVGADCCGTHVWLVRDGERWLMFVGSRRNAGRRRDFASPFLDHAIRTAEQWYGAAGAGWQVEDESNGKEGRQ